MQLGLHPHHFLPGLPLPTCPAPSATQVRWDTQSPHLPPSLCGTGQLDTGPGVPSHFRKGVFRPNPGFGIKGHLSIPRCPALAFLNNIPLCPLPRLQQPPPLGHCLLSPPLWSACLFALQSAGFLLFFSFLSPSCSLQANPLWGHRVWGPGEGQGSKAESMPGAGSTPVGLPEGLEEGTAGTALERYLI